MPAVHVQNLTKYFKRFSNAHKFLTFKSALVNRTIFADLKESERFEALKGISFSLEQGKTLGIIGENGSGKSTLLKILAGISRPTSGIVEVNGRTSALIELGAGFHPEISGRENIYINGMILGLKKREIEERYQQIVEFAELEEFIENPVKSYSSGMFMRLGFSIAINVNPDILLVDEVLAVGDAAFVPKCLDKIAEFKRQGKTIIFVSHDLTTVDKVCDEVIWMKNGRIEQQGYPKRVIDAYLEYVGRKNDATLKKEHQKQEEEKDQSQEKRWGSREVEITGVKIFDSEGRERYLFAADEPLTIKLKIRANSLQNDFVFGFAIFNSEGQLCYGTNTNLEKFQPESIENEGEVTIKIPALNLINGTYFLDLAVHKRDGYPFDYHHFLYTFRVFSNFHDVGITRIAHDWSFSSAIKIKQNDENR